LLITDKKANDRFETTRPTRMRPETITSWDRSRDQDHYCATETEIETETKKVVSRPRRSRDLNIPGIALCDEKNDDRM